MAYINKFELTTNKTNFRSTKIKSSKDAYNAVRKFWHEDIGIYESFFILLLNRWNKSIGYAKISQGGISGTTADIKIIAKYAVDSLASGVILCHNHPSGNVKRSEKDLRLNNRVKEALRLLDIEVIDHIIIAPNTRKYYSFADERET